jgi:hypothetical protein
MPQADIDEFARGLYAETRIFYQGISRECGHLGFKILYGPPLFKAPLLFIGYQPGGGSVARAKEQEAAGTHEGWPDESEYVTKPWRLAKRLRAMFGVELLSQSVGVNALFIRAPSSQKYKPLSRSRPAKRLQASASPVHAIWSSSCNHGTWWLSDSKLWPYLAEALGIS